mgnify:FL=1
MFRLPAHYAFMLVDELAYDLHLQNKASSEGRRKDPSGIDVGEIMKRRELLENRGNLKRYSEDVSGPVHAVKDVAWFREQVGERDGSGVAVSAGTRTESTFFHPFNPPPNGPDGVPIGPPRTKFG